MSAPIECPICMDSIEISKNCVTTECGHCFHTNCLMKSVTHNGFGCPYCRTVMAEEPEDEDEDEDDEEDEEEVINETNYLRGFRLFWNNMNGEEHDEEDILYEVQFEEFNHDEAEEEEQPINIPSHEFIANKLQTKGVSYNDLVKALLGRGDHPEYPEYDYQNLDNEVYGRIRSIISRYDPPQNVSPVEPVEIR